MARMIPDEDRPPSPRRAPRPGWWRVQEGCRGRSSDPEATAGLAEGNGAMGDWGARSGVRGGRQGRTGLLQGSGQDTPGLGVLWASVAMATSAGGQDRAGPSLCQDWRGAVWGGGAAPWGPQGSPSLGISQAPPHFGRPGAPLPGHHERAGAGARDEGGGGRGGDRPPSTVPRGPSPQGAAGTGPQG